MSKTPKIQRGALIPLRQPNVSRTTLSLTLGGLMVLSIVGLFFLDIKGANPWQAMIKALEDMGKMFFQPVIEHFDWQDIPLDLLITLSMAFLTTLIGAICALFLALLSARNIGNKYLSGPISSFVALIRAVPTVLWVLIFAVSAGLGSVAAVVGMSFHSAGYLVKAYTESFEELDDGVIEALKAGGAGWWSIVFQAVLPASMSYLISWTFLRFEINFVQAVALGAAAGAGGIGFNLQMAAGHYANIREVGTFTWIILVTAIIFELVATRLKEKTRLLL